MTDDEFLKSLTKVFIARASILSQQTRESDTDETFAAVQLLLHYVAQFINAADQSADTSLILKVLGELEDIQNGNNPKFLKRNQIPKNRPESVSQQTIRAALSVAQDLLHISGMTYTEARSYIAKRTKFSANQLQEQRKRIRSTGLKAANLQEVELYNHFLEMAKAMKPKQAADAFIKTANNLTVAQ